MQTSSAKLVYRAHRYRHITPLLTELHWLNNKQRIDVKIILITNKAINGAAPGYINNLISLKPNFKILTDLYKDKQLLQPPAVETFLLLRTGPFRLSLENFGTQSLKLALAGAKNPGTFKEKLKTCLFNKDYFI